MSCRKANKLQMPSQRLPSCLPSWLQAYSAIEAYGVHLVVANELHSRKDRVWLVSRQVGALLGLRQMGVWLVSGQVGAMLGLRQIGVWLVSLKAGAWLFSRQVL